MARGSVGRFAAALAAEGLDDTVVELDVQARTASEAAAAMGCEVSQIIKSLVFADAAAAPLLVLVAGDLRVDEGRVARLHGAPVSLAGPDYVRAVSGYSIGGVPPFGHARPLPTLIDRTLRRHETVWAAAGTPRHLFSLPLADLCRVTGGQLAEVGAATP